MVPRAFIEVRTRHHISASLGPDCFIQPARLCITTECPLYALCLPCPPTSQWLWQCTCSKWIEGVGLNTAWPFFFPSYIKKGRKVAPSVNPSQASFRDLWPSPPILDHVHFLTKPNLGENFRTYPSISCLSVVLCIARDITTFARRACSTLVNK